MPEEHIENNDHLHLLNDSASILEELLEGKRNELEDVTEMLEKVRYFLSQEPDVEREKYTTRLDALSVIARDSQHVNERTKEPVLQFLISKSLTLLYDISEDAFASTKVEILASTDLYWSPIVGEA